MRKCPLTPASLSDSWPFREKLIRRNPSVLLTGFIHRFFPKGECGTHCFSQKTFKGCWWRCSTFLAEYKFWLWEQFSRKVSLKLGLFLALWLLGIILRRGSVEKTLNTKGGQGLPGLLFGNLFMSHAADSLFHGCSTSSLLTESNWDCSSHSLRWWITNELSQSQQSCSSLIGLGV